MIGPRRPACQATGFITNKKIRKHRYILGRNLKVSRDYHKYTASDLFLMYARVCVSVHIA